MSAAQKSVVPSTFSERFEFARDRQRVLGTWQEDQELAGDIGVARSQISEYKAREIAPPVERTLALARRIGVDPGWLAFGEDTVAPAPEGFAAWLANRRAPRHGMKPARDQAAAKKRPA